MDTTTVVQTSTFSDYSWILVAALVLVLVYAAWRHFNKKPKSHIGTGGGTDYPNDRYPRGPHGPQSPQ